jgi:hypothetical protein
MVFGVASWSGLGLSATDGMCPRCAVHFRRQWKLPFPTPQAAVTLPPTPPASRGGLLRVAVTLLIVTGLALIANPFEAPRRPAATMPPPETALVPAPVEVQSPTPVDAPRGLQRPRVAPARRIAAAKAATKVSPPPVAPDPAPVVADAPAESVAASVPTEPVVVADPPVQTVRPPAGRRRVSTFAALPHAGLAEQTP